MNDLLIILSRSDRHALLLYIFLAIAALAGVWTLFRMIFRFIRETLRKNRNNKGQ